MKTRVRKTYTKEDVYKYYKNSEWYNQAISKKLYNEIIEEFFKLCTDEMITKGVSLTMPFYLGSIKIIKTKLKPKLNSDGTPNLKVIPVNYKATLELWKKLYPDIKNRKDYKKIKNKPLVRFINKHTDGYIFRFIWDKTTCLIKNQSFYNLVARHKLRRKLIDYVSNPLNEKNYPEFLGRNRIQGEYVEW